MVQKWVTIVNKRGLHARAAAKFVTLASQFPCSIYVRRNNQQLNGKSIMGIMSLAASKGSQIEILADGDNENKALEALIHLVESGFDEKD